MGEHCSREVNVGLRVGVPAVVDAVGTCEPVEFVK